MQLWYNILLFKANKKLKILHFCFQGEKILEVQTLWKIQEPFVAKGRKIK